VLDVIRVREVHRLQDTAGARDEVDPAACVIDDNTTRIAQADAPDVTDVRAVEVARADVLISAESIGPKQSPGRSRKSKGYQGSACVEEGTSGDSHAVECDHDGSWSIAQQRAACGENVRILPRQISAHLPMTKMLTRRGE
jgi:hypothetical protein